MSLNHFLDDTLIDAKFNNISIGKEFVVNQLNLGSTIATGGGTLTATPSMIVSGVLGLNNTTTVNFPSATAVQDYIGTLPTGLTYYNFNLKLYADFAGTATFNLGAGMSTYKNTSSFSYTANGGIERNITFAFTAVGWIVYY